jgi:autotransporter-associated beta strand protein
MRTTGFIRFEVRCLLALKLLAVILAACPNEAHAADVFWFATGPADWNTAANWQPLRVPTGTDNATFNNGGTATITSDTPTFTDLRFGENNFFGQVGGTVNQSAGTLNATGQLRMNISGIAPSTYTLSGGSATFTRVNVNETAGNATSTLNVQGGTLTIPTSNAGGGLGALFVNGGTGSDTGIVNVSGGTLTIGADTAADQSIVVGNGGTNTAQLNVSGTGVVTVTGQGDVNVGNTSPGAINQSGGTVNLFTSGASWLYVGRSANGTYTLSGGALTDPNYLVLGNGTGATGTFNLNAGTATIGQITGGLGTGIFNFNGGILRANASNATFMQGLTAANVQSGGAIIDTNGVNITIAQPLLAAGGGLTKTGNGTLTLSGNNTFSGGLTVQQGALQIATINNAGASGPLGSNASVTLGAGPNVSGQIGTLEFTGSSAASNMPFVLAGGGGVFTVDTISTNLTLSGTISGNGLYKQGSGTLTLSGNNTFYGVVFLNGGTLVIGGPGALNAAGINALLMNGGTLSLAGNNLTVVDLVGSTGIVQDGTLSSPTLTINNKTNNYYSGVIQDGPGGGSLSLVKNGVGTLTLAGANTYSNTTTVNGGTLVLGSAGALGHTFTVTVQNGGALDFDGQAVVNLGSPFTIQGNSLLTNSSTTAAGVVGDINTANSGAFNVGGIGNIILISGFNLTSGSSSITQIGGNTLTLSGADDNLGLALNANAGTVVLAKSSSASVHAIGTGGLTINGGTVQLAGAGGDQISDAAPVTINSGTLDFNGQSETFDLLAGTGGTITNSAAGTTSTMTLGAVGGSGAFAGGIKDSGTGQMAVTKIGGGTETFSGSLGSNVYSGATIINQGVLQGGAPQTFSAVSAMNVASGATFNLGGFSQSIGSLTGSGNVTTTGNTGIDTLTVGFDNTSPPAFSGVISDAPGGRKLALSLASFGTLSLSGNNTFTGGVSLDLGTLQLAGPAALNSVSPNTVTFLTNSTGPASLILNGNSVTIGGLITGNVAGPVPSNASVQNASATGATLTVNNAVANSFSGILQDGPGGGALSLIKTGAGTLTLGGNNTFTGSTVVLVGTLALGNSNALGSTTAGTVVASGATLDLDSTSPVTSTAEPLNIIGAGDGGNGALVNSGVNFGTLSGTVNSPGFTVGGSGGIVLSGSVNMSGNFTLTKIGSGALILSGTTDNFNLAVAVNSGTVILAKTSRHSPNDVHAIGQPGLTVNGGLAQLGGTGGDQIYDLGSVTVTSGAFDTNGLSETIATLSLQGSGIGNAGALVNSAAAFSAITPTGGTTLTGNATIGVTQSTGSLTLNNGISDNVALTKVGAGTLVLNGNPTLNANSSLLVDGGTLRFNAVSGAAAIGTGVTATIASGATLELAGSDSALSNGANRVNITNNSNIPGVLVSGTNQQVGKIDGSGTTQVNAGSDLTANHIIQGALEIGGTSKNPALVTIDASDSSGNPLASVGLGAIMSSPNAPLGAGANLTDPLINATIGDTLATSSPPLVSSKTAAPAAVPEPSSLFLIAVGGLVLARATLLRSTILNWKNREPRA